MGQHLCVPCGKPAPRFDPYGAMLYGAFFSAPEFAQRADRNVVGARQLFLSATRRGELDEAAAYRLTCNRWIP